MSTCASCLKKEANLECGACVAPLCKSCAHFLEEDSFRYYPARPPELSHTTYCPSCFDAKVAPALQEYEEVLERAKDVNVFFNTQGKETRFIKRTEKRIKVEDCDDKDDTVMHLAFLAAKSGFNTIIDVDISSEKVRNGGWQTSKWRGSAIPARVDPEQLKRKFISSPN